MTIEKEVLVYASLPFKKYRWISYIGAFQVGFILFNVMTLPSIKKVREREEQERLKKKQSSENITHIQEDKIQRKTLVEKLKNFDIKRDFTFTDTLENIKDNAVLVGSLFATCGLVLTASNIYARRTIHKITLLPEGRVRFAFFSPLAISEPATLELPLRYVSCISPRKSGNNYSILKLKGFRGYHLVHKAEGEFYEPKLYDKYLGYARTW